MKNLRVLVLSASFGAGHISAAKAIIEAIQSKQPDAEINHLDYFAEFFNKTLYNLVRAFYVGLIKHVPWIWGKLYYKAGRLAPDSLIQRWLNQVGRTGLLKYIQATEPDVIVCTYPTLAGILGELRLYGLLDVPVVTVVTDFVAHRQWVHHGIDLYVAGSLLTAQGLEAGGINREIIKITGIPVHRKFERTLDRQQIRRGLGLDPDLPTVLVMGGAFGVLNSVREICEFVTENLNHAQAIAVCGKDRRVFVSLDSVSKKSSRLVRFGFVNNVEELMSAADLIITKAGGLTVSETLTKRLPLLVYKPIPGQEEENADYMVESGAGRIAHDLRELKEITGLLLKSPDQQVEMRRAASRLMPGRSAERAAEHILALVDKREYKPLIQNQYLSGR